MTLWFSEKDNYILSHMIYTHPCEVSSYCYPLGTVKIIVIIKKKVLNDWTKVPQLVSRGTKHTSGFMAGILLRVFGNIGVEKKKFY